MDAAKTVTATFVERCTTGATDPTCIRVVYLGAPADYANVSDIPADLTFTPDSEGRYRVGRGEQITVVTGGASLPEGYTRFYLQQTPLETPWPVSASQLIPPAGTTYTFTVSTNPDAATLITFDLTAARPFIRPRPDNKPELGDVVVTTRFEVVTCDSGVAVPDPATNPELVEDCEALLAAKNRLAGTATLNWSPGRPMTGWTSVTIAGTPQRVTKLELADGSLTGEIPPALGDLTGLVELRLNDNEFTGRVPSKLSQLDQLTHIYLDGNSLTGCLPSPWSALSTTNDFQAVGLEYCDSPEAVHEHTRKQRLEGGQIVSYQLYGIGSVLTVDLPEGYTFTVEAAIGDTSDPNAPAAVIAFVVTDEDGDQSWVAIDSDTGKEWYRFVRGEGGTTHDGQRIGAPAEPPDPPSPLNVVFDAIVDSAWLRE